MYYLQVENTTEFKRRENVTHFQNFLFSAAHQLEDMILNISWKGETINNYTQYFTTVTTGCYPFGCSLICSAFVSSYKYNHRREGIRYANARPKVIIFCKSCPRNCTWKNSLLIANWLSCCNYGIVHIWNTPFCLVVEWIALHWHANFQAHWMVISYVNEVHKSRQ